MTGGLRKRFTVFTILGLFSFQSALLAAALGAAETKPKQGAQAQGYLYIDSRDEIIAKAKEEGSLRGVLGFEVGSIKAIKEDQPAARRKSRSMVPIYFRESRLYVACEVDEDLPWVVKYTGPDNLVIGSDYGHTDASYVRDLVTRLTTREDLSAEIKENILSKNAKNLYAL